MEIAARHLGDKRRITIYLLGNLGDVYRRQGRLDEAEQLCRRSWEASREVLGEMDRRTLRSLNCLLTALTAHGKVDEALPYVAELIRHRRRDSEQPDASATDLNDYAWPLLTCEPEDLRAPQAALPIAKRAVEMSGGENPGILDTLALAYFMTGDVAKAIVTQEKAVSLLPAGESLLRTDLEANLAKFRQAAKNESPDQGHASPTNKGDQSGPPADRQAGSTSP